MTAAQRQLVDFECEPDLDLSVLSETQREIWNAVVDGDRSGREYARETDRSWGTVSNHIDRACRKLGVERGKW